jgi:hypothetical protein
MDQHRKNKPYGSMLITGTIAIALYAVLLAKQGLINDYFARGGVFAFLPIATAFVFSFVHGSFTGNFWTVLGVEARKKREVR